MPKTNHVHFIGIGGIGTSAIAHIMKKKGAVVSGSDMEKTEITDALKNSGIKVKVGHDAKNITKKIDLVVYSPAISKDNTELVQAEKLGIKTMTYPQALGELSKEYFTIAVSGAHGKSTTTAMIALLLNDAKLDPTVVIGTKIREFKNQNFRVGKSKYLVVEACEYKRSFLNIHPDILVITNIEADHLDYYKDLKDYKNAFTQMSEKVKDGGIIVINDNDKNSVDAIKKTKNKVIKLSEIKKLKIKIEPKVVGSFNKLNASMAAIVGDLLDIPKEKIESSIKNFKGTWRRLEEKKKIGKTRIIDDYGHHPTEITMTLAAIREENPHAKILCVFQPHQHNRTIELLKGFANSFHDVDEVIIPDIYKVRDKAEDIAKISAKILADEINKACKKQKASDGGGLPKTAKFILKNHANYDIIVTMGAGNIYNIYEILK
ncbi:UDP-N-acetylmuramate--L-alanine ligase [Candidatus Gracilibacteria bacterium]|jgi:UDP-N-acetylmuramate--alanine ligase|nr:UDP-N-acetylmuramate--L-alanine ligase [Candidatus Gracilibacteria bacterium]